MYEGHDDLPDHGGDVASVNHPYVLDLRKQFQMEAFREESVRGLRRGYYGCLTHVDRKVGEVMDVLDETGLSDRTVFAYTSDHGEMLGKFGLWWKCSLYEDSVRAPLIVAGPSFRKGEVGHTALSQLDLQASIFAAVGAERPEDWAGGPLQDLGLNDESRATFSEYHGHGVRGSGFVIRKGKWKYMHNCEAFHQLFDIIDDLDDRHESEPKDVADLERELKAVCDPDAENRRAYRAATCCDRGSRPRNTSRRSRGFSRVSSDFSPMGRCGAQYLAASQKTEMPCSRHLSRSSGGMAMARQRLIPIGSSCSATFRKHSSVVVSGKLLCRSRLKDRSFGPKAT
ncbi:MAG: hypothetical protein CME19_03245 [Gemmatimonadetes bacterium]|nr:hypothetical protein [Gemmatimonadota bacterium]